MAKADKIVFSDKQKEFISGDFKPTLDLNEGTIRSGKTTAGHFKLARFYIESEDENHLLSAYNQEQAYRLFIDGDGTGLMHIFDGAARMRHDDFGDHLLINTPKGDKRIYYKGGGKANSVGAITGMSLGSVAFGELNLLNMDFIQEAFRRTVAAQRRWHYADMNPPSPMHPVIKEVLEVQKTRRLHWTMKDNPILTPERIADLEETLKKNPYLYKRDFLGERVMPQGVIYSAFDMDSNVDHIIEGDPVETYFSADGGQSDATSCSFNLVTRKRSSKGVTYHLYRLAHYYHSGEETGETKAMSVYAREIKEFMNWCHKRWNFTFSQTFVDPACKSLREELNAVGVYNSAADNNASDQVAKKGMAGNRGAKIEVGIERARTCIEEGLFSILELDGEYDHYHFVKEIGLYVRGDNGLPVDKDNHAMDEFRYSINYFYKKYIRAY